MGARLKTLREEASPEANLDAALMRQQSGQTIGIPIGPDASLIAAEVVLTAVDVELLKSCKKLRGFRYVDDYELSFATHRDAEQVLADLEGQLAGYELTLNPRKTSIRDAPCEFEAVWPSELKQFSISKSGPKALSSTIDFFNFALTLAREHPNQAVLKYALERVRFTQFSANSRTFHALILMVVAAEPSTLPIAMGLLYREELAGRFPSKKALAETFDSIIERCAPLGRGGEVAWCLWGALRFRIQLSERAAKQLYRMRDDIVALLTLDLEKQALIPKRAIDHKHWTALVCDPDALRQDHWLLTYEAAVRGWLPNQVLLTTDPFFSQLAVGGVRFYDDQQAKLAPAFGSAATPVPGGRLPGDYF